MSRMSHEQGRGGPQICDLSLAPPDQNLRPALRDPGSPTTPEPHPVQLRLACEHGPVDLARSGRLDGEFWRCTETLTTRRVQVSRTSEVSRTPESVRDCSVSIEFGLKLMRVSESLGVRKRPGVRVGTCCVASVTGFGAAA